METLTGDGCDGGVKLQRYLKTSIQGTDRLEERGQKDHWSDTVTSGL